MSSSSLPVVILVDDETSVLEPLSEIIQKGGYVCRPFSSPKKAIASITNDVKCLVTDLKMPELSGDELLRSVKNLDPFLPVIFITGHADVSIAVDLMESGATSVLEKPLDDTRLLRVIRRAISYSNAQQENREQSRAARARMKHLTEDELEILREMVEGHPNKAIASRLQISSRTLDRRRSHVLQVMQVETVVELGMLVAKHGLLDSEDQD